MNHKSISQHPEEGMDFVAKLKLLRDGYSEDIPEEDISGRVTHRSATHKVQRNWWAMLILTLDFMEREKTDLPESFRRSVRYFIIKYTSPEFTKKPRTSEADIQTANNMINKAIHHLLHTKKTASPSPSERTESGQGYSPMA